MSCSLTVDAVRDRTKTVTRRHPDTWRTLAPGDRLTLVEKAMGLPRGAKQVVLAEVIVVDNRVEPLALVDAAECAREGLPEMSPAEFRAMWARTHGCEPHDDVMCRRIEWVYAEEVPRFVAALDAHHEQVAS
jgi:hypothetical protein